MAKPKVAETPMQALQHQRELAASMAKDRTRGGAARNVTKNVLGGLALILGAGGGAAVLADMSIFGMSPEESKFTLGILVLAGGICGSLGTFLKAEARALANKDERAAWEKLVLDIDAAGIEIARKPPPADAAIDRMVADLATRILAQMQADVDRRRI